LRKALIDERTQWLLRIRSTLYHHGLSLGAPGEISGPRGREFLARLPLPLDALERVVIALRMIDMLGAQIHELERELRTIARHQAGCQALMTEFGVGELIALVTLTELGDVRANVKLAQSGAVRRDRHRPCTALITSRVGKLTRQGIADAAVGAQ
jgi:transposase